MENELKKTTQTLMIQDIKEVFDLKSEIATRRETIATYFKELTETEGHIECQMPTKQRFDEGYPVLFERYDEDHNMFIMAVIYKELFKSYSDVLTKEQLTLIHNIFCNE